MTAVRINNRVIVYSGTMLLADGQRGDIEIRFPLGVQIATDVLKVAIKFGNRNHDVTTVDWITNNGVVEFDLKGWKNIDGTVTASPVNFGEMNGKPLFIELAQKPIASINIVTVVISQGA